MRASATSSARHSCLFRFSTSLALFSPHVAGLLDRRLYFIHATANYISLYFLSFSVRVSMSKSRRQGQPEHDDAPFVLFISRKLLRYLPPRHDISGAARRARRKVSHHWHLPADASASTLVIIFGPIISSSMISMTIDERRRYHRFLRDGDAEKQSAATVAPLFIFFYRPAHGSHSRKSSASTS